MARRYARDNRGRFSSTGATARGGRLATASGNKRATQTSKLTKRATPSGAIRKTDVITARVQNAISKNVQQKNPKAGEGPAARVARAERRISARQSRPGTTAPKPAAAKPAAKPAPKVDTSLKGVAARRARALVPRTSTYLSQKLNTQSAITRSAANAIYNRQRAVGKQLGLDQSVVRNPIGIMPKASGSIRNMAMQVREAARKRVVGGRRR